jgi:uncharacterized protein YfaS (alpha-2-macroglobulin family)
VKNLVLGGVVGVVVVVFGVALAGEDDDLGRYIKKGPLPPPRIGEQVKLPFPPPAHPAPPRPTVQHKPLEVTLHQPEGTEQQPPAISVSFNQPMVAVTAVGEVAQNVPVRIEPAIEGIWKWQGSSTISLVPKKPLAHATRYKLTVPAGTRSAGGQVLAKDFSWTFDTQRPAVTSMNPYDNATEIALDPPLLIFFNQAVSVDKVKAALTIADKAGHAVGVKTIPRGEWKTHPQLAGYANSSSASAIAAFRLDGKLTPDTQYTITVRAAAVSDEGPLPMAKDHVAHFSTYPPMAVKNVACGECRQYNDDSAKTCEVGQGLCVSFNHQVKVAKLDDFIRVTPRPADLKLRADHSGVHLEGSYQAETSYTVEVAPGVRDQYEQTLKTAWSAAVRYQHRPSSLQPLVERVALIELKGALELPVRVVNMDEIKLAAYRVPDDRIGSVVQMVRYSMDDSSFQQELATLSQLKVATWKERPRAQKDKEVVHQISLKALVAQHGAGPYLIVPEHAEHALLLQLTDLGLTARYDSNKMVVLATSIASGRPVSGVKVVVQEPKGVAASTATTGQDGIAVVRAPSRDPERTQSELRVVASLGRDRSFLDATSNGDDGRSVSLNWGGQPTPAYKRGFLYADRDLYRPGETVEVYGIERQYRAGQDDRLSVPADASAVSWKAHSSRRRELGAGSATRSPFGTFHFSVKLPEEIDLGNVHIETSVGSTSVNVQEYRAPEFEVGVKLAKQPVFLSGELHATVTGRYLFGAPMSGAMVRWTLFGDDTRFSPADHGDFHFGSAIDPRHYEHWRWRGGPSQLISGTAKLDGKGRFELQTELSDLGEKLDPTSLILEAQVTDVSRQVVAGRDTVLAHPADRYVGVRTGGAPLEANRPAPIDVVVVDLAGKRVSGASVTLSAQMQDHALDSDTDDDGNATTKVEEKTLDATGCTVTSDAAPRPCTMRFPKPGLWTLEARSMDGKQHKILTRTYLYVIGKDLVAKDTAGQKLELRADRRSYQAGESAQVSIRAPFADGVALVTTERRGLLGHQLVRISKHVGTARIALKEEQIPGVDVTATAVAARGKGVAAWAAGATSIEIARDKKRLTVTVTPQKTTARPGDKVMVEVAVTDAQKRPIKARVSLVGVDEAVLSMSGFALPDPLSFFHYLRDPDVALAVLLKLLLPEERKNGSAHGKEKAAKMAPVEADMASGEGAMGAAGGPGGGGRAAVTRRLFLTTPLADVVTTDAQGKARFTLPLPDNLTRFRLMAIAADDAERFGGGESGITVNRPLQLRTALPRFLNTSDAVTASVIVDNQGGQAGEAEVTIDADGVDIDGARSVKISVGAGEAKEASFQLRAPRPGSARVRFTARLGQEQDAVERRLPIWTPATSEAFATYGTTTSAIAQPISAPKDILAGFGGLSITLAATALTGLQDAARYLIEYPYGCAEQISSRAMPLLVLGDIVGQFGIGGADVLALQKKHAAIAVRKLIDGQRGDGSWGTWASPNDEARADLTAYILIVLRRGKEAGYDVPAETVTHGVDFLRKWVASHDKADPKQPDWYPRWSYDVSALALYAMSDWSRNEPALAKQLNTHAALLDTFAKALLASVFHRISPASPERAALLREVLNRAIQTPAAARFQEQQSEGLQLLMHSSARTDAIVLLSLLELEPKNELVPKIVRGLMDARINGSWDTTQANAYSLWALSRYFKVYEAEPTAFTAGMWLGKGYLGESKFEARSMREEHLEVPMKVVQGSGAGEVTIAKEGSGRVYFRIGMKYAPKSFELTPTDQGMTVSRSYEAVDKPDDVVRGKDGWSMRAGAYVRVRLSLTVQDRRHYVVIDDALPAGLELVNTAYKTAARDGHGERGEDWTSWRFNHRELRDERSLHFADELEPGTYNLNVLTRATSRGRFLVPPTRAEEMYRPEVFGRGGTDHVTVR